MCDIGLAPMDICNEVLSWSYMRGGGSQDSAVSIRYQAAQISTSCDLWLTVTLKTLHPLMR